MGFIYRICETEMWRKLLNFLKYVGGKIFKSYKLRYFYLKNGWLIGPKSRFFYVGFFLDFYYWNVLSHKEEVERLPPWFERLLFYLFCIYGRALFAVGWLVWDSKWFIDFGLWQWQIYIVNIGVVLDFRILIFGEIFPILTCMLPISTYTFCHKSKYCVFRWVICKISKSISEVIQTQRKIYLVQHWSGFPIRQK